MNCLSFSIIFDVLERYDAPLDAPGAYRDRTALARPYRENILAFFLKKVPEILKSVRKNAKFTTFLEAYNFC